MKNKYNVLLIVAIFVVPIVLYSVLHSQRNEHTTSIASIENKPVVIDFYSPMCYACTKLSGVMHEVEQEYSERIIFKKLNVASMDQTIQQLAKKYNVMVVPTLIFLNKDGSVNKRTEGLMSKPELEDNLNSLLK